MINHYRKLCESSPIYALSKEQKGLVIVSVSSRPPQRCCDIFSIRPFVVASFSFALQHVIIRKFFTIKEIERQ